MLKGMVVEIKNTYNSQIPQQYNVKVLVISGQSSPDTFVYLDIRDHNKVKVMHRGMIISFSTDYKVSKNRFIHSKDVRLFKRERR